MCTEVVHTIWQKHHLISSDTEGSHLHTTCFFNVFLHLGSQITLTRQCVRERSAEICHATTEVISMVRKKKLPHVSLTSRDVSQTIFSCKYPCEQHILAKIIPHALKHPKMVVSQSTILPIPKYTAQSGNDLHVYASKYPECLSTIFE